MITKSAKAKTKWASLSELVGDEGLIVDGDWVESKDQDPAGAVRLLQLADVGVGAFLNKSARFMTLEKARKLRCTFLREGDILVARMPDPIGRACKFPGSSMECVTVVDVCILRTDDKIVDSAYLVHAINSSVFANQLNRFIKGTTRQRISRRNLEQILLPLPSLPEQSRIAAILEKADALRIKRRAAIALLDELSVAIFIEMFGDPVTNSKGWKDSESLGDVSEIVSGVAKGRKLNGKKTRKIPYLAVLNVQDKSLNLSTVKEIEATDDEIERYRLKADDLLLTEGGDPDKLGRGTLWREELPECIHQNHIFRVRLHNRKILLPHYLNWLVGSQRGKKYFLRSAKQTTGIATINMTQLRSFPLLLPPVGLQNEFLLRINQVEVLKAKLIHSSEQLESLFSSLQHLAFKGEQ